MPAESAPAGLVRRHAIAPDGVGLCYWQAGPGTGETVVLCHGLGAGSAQFRDDAAFFSALGYRVLVPDLRGHGDSGAPATYEPADFAIPVLAADMLAVLDHAGAARVHWVGNSLGGIVGFEIAASHPERLATLATFGTAHALTLPAVTVGTIALVFRLLGPRLTGWVTALGTTRHVPARPLVARMLEDFDPRVGVAIATNLRHYDLTDAALAYPGPLLLLRGGQDAQINRALARTLPRFMGRPGFSLVELPEGGHCANLDASASWRAALLDFWRAASG